MAIRHKKTCWVALQRLRASRIWLLPVLLVAMICRVSAGIRPSFHLDYNAWEATHIVVVEATAEDGVFEVVESWKGDLHPGQRITIPDLTPRADAVPLSMYSAKARYLPPNDTSASTQIPKQVSGDQLVLFLKEDTQPEGSSELGQAQGARWQPASVFHDMKTSAVWIGGTSLYGFMQTMNPGPSILERLSWFEREKSSGAGKLKVREMTTSDLQTRVDQVIRTQQELARVVHIEDSGVRAEKLRTYVRSDVVLARNLAFAELGKAGPSALPVLRAMLEDPEYAELNEMVMHAYIQAGGVALAEELNARLRSQLAFWKATGPSLVPGWWNQDAPTVGPLRQRYSVTLEILRGLETSPSLSALNTAIELRDFWRSLPQLNDPSGLNQLAEECDKLIRHIQQ